MLPKQVPISGSQAFRRFYPDGNCPVRPVEFLIGLTGFCFERYQSFD